MQTETTARHADFLEKRFRKALFSLFGEMDEATFFKIRTAFEWVDLPGGRYLFKQGDEGQTLYVLASGRLKILQNQDGQIEDLGEIPPGETVGEMALITGEARSADALAMRDSVLARLDKAAFDNLVREFPQGLMRISKKIIERFQGRKGRTRHKKIITNLCLLPISEGLDIGKFSGQLAEALAEFGPLLFLDSPAVNRLLEIPEIAQAGKSSSDDYRRITSWLEEQESNHRFVVYLPDNQDNEWTRRCIRQADEILLIGNSGETPELHWAEKKYLRGESKLTLAGETLVLVHPENTELPSGTRQWLKIREVKFHHHVRGDNFQDVARLSRFLSGNAVGLVFSGGAARGAAHVGVFRALEEKGFFVDAVGGTSIGAVVAALVARDWPAKKIRENLRPAFMSNPTSDFNLLPRVSIFKGKKLDRLLTQYFENQRIEDLWLPFFCVSCNLTTTNPRIHRSGDLMQSIRASIAIPGVLPPAQLDDELHVDGGVFNNMPVDVINRFGVGTIIAVDLQSNKKTDGPKSSSSKKLRLPNLVYVVMEASMLSGKYLSQEFKNDVDIYFNPPLRDFGWMDWTKFDKMEELGHSHALEVLE